MTHACRLAAASALLIALAGCAAAPAPITVEPAPAIGNPAVAPTATAAAQLNTLLDDEWQRGLRESPEFASSLGDHRYDDRWSDLSLESFARSQEADMAALKRLAAIPRTQLSAADALNHELFRQQLQERVEGYRFRNFLMPVSQQGGVQQYGSFTEVLRFETLKDYENWLARLRGFDAVVNQTVALMRQGLAEGRTPPQIIMQRLPGQIDKQLVAKAEASAFYMPFKTFAADITPAEQERLRAEARQIIEANVLPAFKRFRDFFVTDYLPRCRSSIGASALPDGAAYYAFAAHSHTTTTLTPDEIHAIGLKEVARIRGEMETVKAQVGFSGSLAKFFTYLRTDKRFFVKAGQGELLLERYRATAKRIDGELPKLFGRLPRLPYGVRPIPMDVAPDVTTAYYQPGAADGSRAGFYYVNLYKPETRPLWEIEALSAHEAMPGHHLQIALGQELGELPEFRRNGYYTAFGEGWGLYSESLGYDLGLYQDPYSKFGQLTYEMWRAVRLVVDTGMHAKGWSREQAIAYFRNNTARAELDIVNEVDRYIADPGQALAYKIGQLKIKQLRERAQAALGGKFDIRAFHDTVLGSGAVPLDVLEQQVERWIAERKAG